MITLVTAVCFIIWSYGDLFLLETEHQKLIAIGTVIIVSLVISVVWLLFQERRKDKRREKNSQTGTYPNAEKRIESNNHLPSPILEHLKSQYGTFWRKKVAIHLLIGSPAAVEKLAPHLPHERWQECEGTLLIYGGDIHHNHLDTESIDTVKHLRRRRPLDGVIWVTENTVSAEPLDTTLTLSHLNTTTADRAGRLLQQLFQSLKWRAPVWVWSVSDSAISCDAQTPAVLCLTEPALPAEQLSPTLLRLLPTLITQGTQALLQHVKHRYLLSLAQSLRHGGSQQLATALAPLITPRRALPFAGIALSPPEAQNDALRLSHQGVLGPRWQSWLKVQPACAVAPSPIGVTGKQVMQYTAATAMMVWGVGMVTSYFMNRQLIRDSQADARIAVDTQRADAERLAAQFDFQQRLGLLHHREQTRVPLWLRFGLNTNDALLTRLWPVYQHTVLPPLQDTVAVRLVKQLDAFATLPPDSTARADATPAAYQALKTYLMMTTPARMEPTFFTTSVLATVPPPANVPAGEWQTVGKALLNFYAQQLPLHPEWALTPQRGLVSRSRTLLIRQLGQRSESATLYQQVLLQAQHQFADLTLDDMTGGTDVSFLFTTDEFVPGLFTRKAWEEAIEPAIDKAVNVRRSEIDWVLTDNQHALDSDISPEHLKQQLTDRYFADFAGSWLNFLNSLQWRHTDSLADTLDQLTLMSDVRQSPVIALMNTVAYQGQTGRQSEKLTDSLVSSAKELFSQEQKPTLNQHVNVTGPLEEVFGPLLHFVDPSANPQLGDSLGLQAYLTRITRVRLKLQQVVNAPDPQALSQALARSILEGKAVEFVDTRDTGSLLAASLGQAWQAFGETLLVEPMTQAWQQLLTPTTQGINQEWQNSIVNEWNSAFGGRYPLKNSQSDIALPLMAQYLRPDTGRIQRFLETRLQGVLRKEGNHWVPNTDNAQGLRFNPAFLQAMDTLTELGDVVFANGEARLYFEIRPSTSKNVMQTVLVIDKQTLTYDNQFPEWQRFAWPADTVASGAALMWMTTTASTRLYGDYPGVWGLIRLLETAKTTPYAGSASTYTLSWSTFGGNVLNYQLRTEMGQGPLALLKLRNFVLPKNIFLD